jgi:hypothetical protein
MGSKTRLTSTPYFPLSIARPHFAKNQVRIALTIASVISSKKAHCCETYLKTENIRINRRGKASGESNERKALCLDCQFDCKEQE